MTREQYIECMDRITNMHGGVRGVCVIGKILTYTAAVAYIISVCVYGVMAVQGKVVWYKPVALVMIPGVSFVLLSIFREIYNARRPYEVYGFTPLIPKDTIGKSFPSRHVFSIFVIGSSLNVVSPYLSTAIMCMGCILAAIRVVTGVHFPKDVIVGAALGYLCGLFVGFF